MLIESMPTETMIAAIAIILPFAFFAMALAYADYQSNQARQPHQ